MKDANGLSAAPARCQGPAVDHAALAPSLGAFLADLVARTPDGEVTAVPLAGAPERRTFTALWQQAWGGLAALSARGVAPGEPVRPLAPQLGDRVAQGWACLLGGYPMVIAAGDLPAETLPPGCVTWSEPPAADRGAPSPHAALGPAALPPAAIAAYLATSGTTDRARLACVSERALRTRFCDRVTGFGDRETDMNDPTAAHLVLFPWHSVTGMSVFFPRAPKTVCLDPQALLASPRQLLALLERERIGYVALSSSFAAVLNEALRLADRVWDLSALKRIGIGVEPVVPGVFRTLRERLAAHGAAPAMLAGYGMTETGLLCGMTADSALADTWYLGEAPVCLGPPRAGWRLRVVDDQDRLLAEGEQGHLQVDSPDKAFSGYLGDVDKPLATFSADGWFRTGDLGVIRDGQVTVTGRGKETLIIHGTKYPPQRIEAALRGVSGIWQGQVYAFPVRRAESVTDALGIAFVPEPGCAVAETVAALRRQLATALRLSAARVEPLTANELPRTATGKVQRLELARRWMRRE